MSVPTWRSFRSSSSPISHSHLEACPANAPKTDLSGFKPNVEAIAAKKPDLVVIADDGSGLSGSLKNVNIRVLVQPAVSLGVDMPVSHAVAAILRGASTIDAAIESLLARPFKAEE